MLSRIRCHSAQFRSYRTSVQSRQLRLGAVKTIEEFAKSGRGLLLKNSSKHYFTPVRLLVGSKRRYVRNDIKYEIPVELSIPRSRIRRRILQPLIGYILPPRFPGHKVASLSTKRTNWPQKSDFSQSRFQVAHRSSKHNAHGSN